MTAFSDQESYGFVYEHDGRNFAFDIAASSAEDAKARLASLANAECIGRLVRADDAEGERYAIRRVRS
jgi:hypothetical protein